MFVSSWVLPILLLNRSSWRFAKNLVSNGNRDEIFSSLFGSLVVWCVLLVGCWFVGWLVGLWFVAALVVLVVVVVVCVRLFVMCCVLCVLCCSFVGCVWCAVLCRGVVVVVVVAVGVVVCS